MQFIDLKTQQEKINDIRFVIASAAKRSIHMVLDCRSRIRSFAMTPFLSSRVQRDLNETLSGQKSSINTSLIIITK